MSVPFFRTNHRFRHVFNLPPSFAKCPLWNRKWIWIHFQCSAYGIFYWSYLFQWLQFFVRRIRIRGSHVQGRQRCVQVRRIDLRDCVGWYRVIFRNAWFEGMVWNYYESMRGCIIMGGQAKEITKPKWNHSKSMKWVRLDKKLKWCRWKSGPAKNRKNYLCFWFLDCRTRWCFAPTDFDLLKFCQISMDSNYWPRYCFRWFRCWWNFANG